MIGVCTGCGKQFNAVYPDHNHVETFNQQPQSIVKQDEALVNHDIKEVTISAVGDIIFHKWQLWRGYNETTDSFDFTDTFQYVKKYLQDSDYVIGNLETTLAGRNNGRVLIGENAYKGYVGFPCFNTPEILAKNLKDAGFDMVSTANNHALDSHPEGALKTLDYLDEQGIDHVGTYRSREEADGLFRKTINGIDFAFLSYTYGTNGFEVPIDQPYLINTLDMYSEVKIQAMLDRVREARRSGTDFVVVSVHFGNEYFDYPNVHQKKMTDRLFEAGADIILGSHPHVLQPFEIRDIKSDDGSTRKGLVIYSLGNFISSQRYTREYPSQTDIGVILDFKFQKIDNHKPQFTGISFMPTCTFRDPEKLIILPVDEVLDHTSAFDIELGDYSLGRLTFTKDYAYKHLLSYTISNYQYKDYKYSIRFD